MFEDLRIQKTHPELVDAIGHQIYNSFFYVLLTVHLSIFILVINQLDAQNFYFTISLFHASTCFEHNVLIIRRSKLCDDTRGCIIQF